MFSKFTDAQDACGRCPLQCSSSPRQKLPACPRDIERVLFVFQFPQRCLKQINTALTFTNCSLDYVSQSHSVALYRPRTQNTQLMSVLLLPLALSQTLQSTALTKLSKAMSVALWQEESAWALDDFWGPLQPVLFLLFSIFHTQMWGFSQQLDFLEHALPAKRVQLYMQTQRQNNLYEQLLSGVTSQVTFITIHMKYWNLWMYAFVFNYIQLVKLSLQRESTLFRKSWILLLSLGGIMRNSSFWKYYLVSLEHNVEADKFTLNNDSEMRKVST